MSSIRIKNKLESQENTQCNTDPTPRINLSTAEDIRREMGRVYREARSKKLATNDATKLTYILTQMLKAVEIYLLEERLTTLELTHSGGVK
jgi:hypothetical protein